jgi:hypothetical protein
VFCFFFLMYVIPSFLPSFFHFFHSWNIVLSQVMYTP